MLHAGTVQGTNGVCRIGPDGVSDCQYTQHFTFAISVRLMADDDNRLGPRLDFGQCAFDLLGTNRQFVGKPVIADEIIVSVDLTLGTASVLGAIMLAARKRNSSAARKVHDCLGEWMFGVNANRGGDAEQCVLWC